MKTETRATILKTIEKKGKIRPSELQQSLKISPQAIHRHLRSLVDEGLIEPRGSSPFTQYALAGVPDLVAVSTWINAKNITSSPREFVCETRENFSARLPRLRELSGHGLSPVLLPLVISTAGEIGNNSFDHNLGNWRDVPGCWFEHQVTGNNIFICIGDRGQGIFRSLTKVHPEISDEQMALKAAFETIISGRAPEQRGNGLKFVRKHLSETPGGGIACISGSASIYYGDQGARCLTFLERYFTEVKGTINLMIWKIK